MDLGQKDTLADVGGEYPWMNTGNYFVEFGV